MIEIGVTRREDQDRNVVRAAQLAADGQAILAGQQQVEQHQPRMFLREPLERAIAARFHRDPQAVLPEIGGGELGEAGIVLDEQDVDIRGGHRTSQTCRVRR